MTKKTYYSLTMFFRNPSTMCTDAVGSATAVGDGLWIRVKAVFLPLVLPAYLKSVPPQPFWVKGKYFASMGVHYWGGAINLETKAMDIYPVVLLFNGCVFLFKSALFFQRGRCLLWRPLIENLLCISCFFSGMLNGFGWVVSSLRPCGNWRQTIREPPNWFTDQAVPS